MSPSVRLSRSWTLSSPIGSTADRQSPSVPSVSFLLGGVLPPRRRGGTCPSSSRTVRGRLATNLLVGTRCSPLRPPSRATVLSHTPPLCVPQPEPAWHHRDTLRAFHAPGTVRRDHKQGRPQPPQRRCTLPCPRLIRNVCSLRDPGRLLRSTLILFNLF